MKRFFWSFAWILLTASLLLVSVAVLHFRQLSIARRIVSPPVVESPVLSDSVGFDGKTNGRVMGLQAVIEAEDARIDLLTRFLDRHDSPLQPSEHFAEVFVYLADKNGFDFRLLPAIAMQESNLCKKIPPGSYNCLGFGIHERGTLTFESYEANFERAARELKANYIDIGLDTPEKIMRKYTPSSNGSWANSVNQWMAEIRYDDRTMGRELKQDGSVLEFVAASDSATNP